MNIIVIMVIIIIVLIVGITNLVNESLQLFAVDLAIAIGIKQLEGLVISQCSDENVCDREEGWD